jgi:hypothetical protein
MKISGCHFKDAESQSITPLPTPTDLLKGVFDQLAPTFTRLVIDGRKELKRQGCRPIEMPLDILIKVARAHLKNVARRKDQATVPKGASGEDVPIQ